MVCSWPLISMVGHGVGNWKILYGGLLYIGYTLFTVYAAYHALHSLEAFKILGRKTYAGQVGAQQGAIAQGTVNNGNDTTVAVGGAGGQRNVARKGHGKYEDGDDFNGAVPAHGNNANKNQQGEQDINHWVQRKMSSSEKEKKQNGSQTVQRGGQQGQNGQQAGAGGQKLRRAGSAESQSGGRGRKSTWEGDEKDDMQVFNSASITMSQSSTRRSMEMADAVVQGTLISHLHSHMFPRMRNTMG